MPREGIFTTHVHKIILPTITTPFEIWPFGDVHLNAPGCNKTLWNEYRKEARKKSGARKLFIGVADYNEFASWGGQKALAHAKLHDSEKMVFDRTAYRAETNFVKDIEFMADRKGLDDEDDGNIIGFSGGNHDWAYLTGASQWNQEEQFWKEGRRSSEQIAERLNAKYLGELAYIRLNIAGKNTTTTYHYDIVIAHGVKAGGKCPGTSINQVEELRDIFPMADIYIMGHDHQRWTHPLSTLHAESGQNGKLTIKEKRQYLVRSGSFLKSFEEDSPSYLVGRLKKPSELGWVRLMCKIIAKRTGEERWSFKDIRSWS